MAYLFSCILFAILASSNLQAAQHEGERLTEREAELSRQLTQKLHEGGELDDEWISNVWQYVNIVAPQESLQANELE